MGWYKRWSEEMIRSDIWKNVELRHLWGDLLDLAGCDPGDGKIRDLLTLSPLSTPKICEILLIKPQKFEEILAILREKGMVEIDGDGYITICKWRHFQSEYRRKSSYQIRTNDGTKKVTMTTDTEYILYLSSLYKRDKRDIENEIIKMRAWISVHPGRELTRRFIVNWLNKLDRPFEPEKPKPPKPPPPKPEEHFTKEEIEAGEKARKEFSKILKGGIGRQMPKGEMRQEVKIALEEERKKREGR